ncbi:hypothetical protein F5Y16DRAFT_398397 [Xylariaceae sp. FL0255]|nr:hypothetical protein F5Y16DRAFT_398397 [Xylariaceae sp. FL0255]
MDTEIELENLNSTTTNCSEAAALEAYCLLSDHVRIILDGASRAPPASSNGTLQSARGPRNATTRSAMAMQEIGSLRWWISLAMILTAETTRVLTASIGEGILLAALLRSGNLCYGLAEWLVLIFFISEKTAFDSSVEVVRELR